MFFHDIVDGKRIFQKVFQLILRKNYQEWKKYKAPKGDRVFPRQMFIAENLLKLLSISA